MLSISAIGHLGKDPVIKTTESGEKIAKFSLASTNKKGNDSKTIWLSVSVFGKLSDVVEKHLKKGDRVFITGKPTLNTWQSQSGEFNASIQVSVKELEMLGSFQKQTEQTAQLNNSRPDYDDSDFIF